MLRLWLCLHRTIHQIDFILASIGILRRIIGKSRKIKIESMDESFWIPWWRISRSSSSSSSSRCGSIIPCLGRIVIPISIILLILLPIMHNLHLRLLLLRRPRSNIHMKRIPPRMHPPIRPGRDLNIFMIGGSHQMVEGASYSSFDGF